MEFRSTLMAALAVVLAGPATAQDVAEGDAPRVDGRSEAAGAEVAINEVLSADYPDVRVIATVTEDGAPLTGLTADDFRVREDEVEQSPLTVEEQLPPLSVVLAIDTSGSMAQAMDQTRTAATEFVRGLADGDAVQVVAFAEEATAATPMLTDTAPAEGALAGLVARGDTALYDAILLSVDLVAEREGRKAVVVLSDGVDDDGQGQPLSTATIPEVLARAGETSVPVFTIGLGTEMDESVLRQVAGDTGGVYLSAPDAEDLQTVYGTIGQQLSGQYSIRYTSSLPADGTERRVDLEAPGGQGSKVYAAPGEAPAETTAETAAAAPVGDGTCEPLAVIDAERPELEKGSTRYSNGLINSTQWSGIRNGAVDRIASGLEATPARTLDCALEALAAADGLYTAGQINSSNAAALTDVAMVPLVDICMATDGIDDVTACYTAFKAAYQAGSINSSEQRELKEVAKGRLTMELAGLGDTDAALALLATYNKEGLLTSSEYNELQSAVLAAE